MGDWRGRNICRVVPWPAKEEKKSQKQIPDRGLRKDWVSETWKASWHELKPSDGKGMLLQKRRSQDAVGSMLVLVSTRDLIIPLSFPVQLSHSILMPIAFTKASSHIIVG